MKPYELIQTVKDVFGVDVMEKKSKGHTYHNDAVYFVASLMRDQGMSYFEIGAELDRNATSIMRGIVCFKKRAIDRESKIYRSWGEL